MTFSLNPMNLLGRSILIMVHPIRSIIYTRIDVLRNSISRITMGVHAIL